MSMVILDVVNLMYTHVCDNSYFYELIFDVSSIKTLNHFV